MFLRPIVGLLLVVSLQACMRWRLVPNAKDVAVKPLGTVRLTTNSEPRHLIVQNPTISHDSVVWTVPQRGGIPLDEIESVESRAPDRMRTGFFILAGVSIVTLITLLQ